MMRIIGLILLVCLAGCGYHFPGQSGTLPGNVEKLYVQKFVNKTTEPSLENKLSSRIREVFARSSKISQVGSEEKAEAILHGTIQKYESRALSYDKNDDISVYRSAMTADVVLQRVGSKEILWEKTVKWSSDYRAAENKGTQEDFRQMAINDITLRLSEEILRQLFDDF